MRHEQVLTELAWAAGIIDGNGPGGVRIIGRTDSPIPRFYVELEVKSSSFKICNRLYEIFGVGVAKEARTQRIENKSKVNHWFCNTKQEVAQVLELVLPYLFAKREEANVLLEFCKTQNKEQEAEVYSKYFALKQRSGT